MNHTITHLRFKKVVLKTLFISKVFFKSFYLQLDLTISGTLGSKLLYDYNYYTIMKQQVRERSQLFHMDN